MTGSLTQTEWQAYRYLTGDLDAAQWQAFDARLADDLNAQHALAQMVPLVLAISSRGPAIEQPVAQTVPCPPNVRPASRWRVMVGVTTAALLVVAGMLMNPANQFDIGNSPSSASLSGKELDLTGSQSLMTLWSELADEPVLSANHNLEDDLAPAHDLDIPRWMLAAVEAERLDFEQLPHDGLPTDPTTETHDRL